MPITTTIREYKALQDAYDFFNKELFSNSLPQVLITLQRHSKSLGYHKANSFANRNDKTTAHEIALNPDGFTGSSDEEILSTLVHEMAHNWQLVHGTPSRSGYHDKQWASKMKEIGLYPSNTEKPGGKEVGQKMSHYIVQGGAYAKCYAKLAATGFKLNWQSQSPLAKAPTAKSASKTKYTCESCDLNAWAKPNVLLICGECIRQGVKEPKVMQPN
jgi:predicted SprT family Zn-dependent metalloprotease